MSEFQENENKPLNPTETATVVILTIFFGAMIFASLFKEFSIYKLSVPIFIVSWAVLLVIHEFGHAIMAKLVGWHVDKVSIGTGRLIGVKKICGLETEFRAIPLSGYVIPRPADLVKPQLKNFLIYFAGPGIELFLVAVLWSFTGSEVLFQRQPELWIITIQTFCSAAVFGAFVNLIPLPFESGHGKKTPSDGLGMILSWQIPDSEYAKWIEKD